MIYGLSDQQASTVIRVLTLSPPHNRYALREQLNVSDLFMFVQCALQLENSGNLKQTIGDSPFTVMLFLWLPRDPDVMSRLIIKSIKILPLTCN